MTSKWVIWRKCQCGNKIMVECTDPKSVISVRCPQCTDQYQDQYIPDTETRVWSRLKTALRRKKHVKVARGEHTPA
jgi:hypothetical protein